MAVEPRERTTISLWSAVAICIAALLVPWGSKHVVEDHCGCDGMDAYYRLGGIESRWEVEGPGGMEERYLFEFYWEYHEDHHLPADPLLTNVDTLMGLATAAVIIAVAARGFRPGPRRERVAAWAVAVAACGYLAAATGTLVAMALHAVGWKAQSVGPFIPWLGSWLAVAALMLLFTAVLRMDLLPGRAVEGMPALPSDVQSGDQ